MGTFFVYILKSSFCLVAFYLFYRLLLSRETFHRFNRIALLGTLVLSLLIPFCDVSTKEPQTIIDWQKLLLMANSPDISVRAEATSVSWTEIVLLIYLAGFLFFFCRNLYSLVRLIRLLKGSKREILSKGVILIIHQKKIAPFSWMKYVVILDSDMKESGREILIHEIAHIQNRHSIDLLLAELCILFHWFNPAAWLMKQELQNIHEYEADETVINKGIDAKQYQLLLIKKAVGTRLYSMANSFNHSKLKKRITMMLKEKSNPWARLKYLYILPLAALAVTAFARPEISNQLNEISAVEISDLSSIVKGNSGNNIPNATNLGNEGAKQLLPDVKNHTVACDTTTSLKSGTNPLVLLNGEEVAFGSKESGFEAGAHPLIIVDGKEVSNEKVIRVRAKSINVLKGKNATDLYGDRAKDGVVQVYTKDAEDSYSGLGSHPLVIVDGKEVAYEELEKINPNKIESMNVLKDKSATTLYGDKGKNGVIEIHTKGNSSSQAQSSIREEDKNAKNLNDNTIRVRQGTQSNIKDVVYIIDGKKSSDIEFSKLNPDDIISVNVLKGDQTKEYGKKAKNGVIIITTKKAQ
ncbi:M56 family metallopeptidase [uncultured Bacteroides sp.]|uniref:M56 family metallopeptidase n=1 Tax=uncultured Bacteroides sp. TaxID=162156 RepID=UPI00374A2C32